MTNKAILEYNQYLLLTDSRPDIIEYIKHINTLSNEPIDLSFMEELLSFVGENTCCIPHTLFIKYGAFNERNASNNVKNTLELYEFKEDTDFRLLNVQESAPKGGCTHKIIYYLKPSTFKFILIRSKCERKYAKYYLLLEESIKYYHDFQIMYKDFMLKQKDDKIDEQSKKIDNLLDQNKELLANTRDIKEDLNTLIDFSVDQAEQIELSESKIKTVITDRIDRPDNKNNIEQLLLFSYKDNYYVVRGTLSYVKTKYRSLTQVTFPKKSKTDYVMLKHFINVPNARHLFRVLKEKYNIISNGNSFDTTLDPIPIIQEIIDNRYTININLDIVKAKKTATKKVLSIVNHSRLINSNEYK